MQMPDLPPAKVADCKKERLTNGPRCLCCGAKWLFLGRRGRQMLLTGNYERALDEKLRLALPRAIREALRGSKQLVLTPGTDGSLSLFPSDAFANVAQR